MYKKYPHDLLTPPASPATLIPVQLMSAADSAGIDLSQKGSEIEMPNLMAEQRNEDNKPQNAKR
ncbi:hypothetical protein AUC45_07000 [Erythrobacter sp. YT30]|nr:hypothetical protein AUC45_07000 [Erythrobacter sp. YT30]